MPEDIELDELAEQERATSWERTAAVAWVYGKLHQRWVNKKTGDHEWRPVPNVLHLADLH